MVSGQGFRVQSFALRVLGFRAFVFRASGLCAVQNSGLGPRLACKPTLGEDPALQRIKS